ncbi:UDP-galactopyranose mutase [Porticoccus sp.]
MNKVAIAGAGFSGAVLAHEFAKHGISVDVFESRDHIGGNCYTYRDEETGILIHKYGPHIFHTDNEMVWEYVNRFSRFMPFVNRVKACFDGKIYSLPVNLHTINQLYETSLSPEEARQLIETEADLTIESPVTFEQQAKRFIGEKLYKAFFYGYTKKQWGCEPAELPASILKRLPVRFNYDDNYFSHHFQGIPAEGYTPIFEALLDDPRIDVHLETPLPKEHSSEYDHTFYSGGLDAYFSYKFGDLAYRSLQFDEQRLDGDYQGCAVMNYCDYDIPYTRITEHKYFSPWEQHDKTIIFKEYSFPASREDIPFYPIRLASEKKMLAEYVKLAETLDRVTFLGRLGTYRYLDMDKTIEEALSVADLYLDSRKQNRTMPVFVCSPLV